MREVGRNAVLGSFTTAGGNLVGFVVRFVMSAILARYIAPDQFGVYAQASVYATAVGLLSGFSFPQALMQLPDMPGINATVNRFTALTGLAMIVLAGALTPLVATLRDGSVAECFFAIVVGQAVAAYGGTYEGDLLRRHQWHAAAALRLGANLVTVAVCVALGIVMPGPFVLVLREAMTPIAMVAVMAFIRWKKGAPRDRYDPTTARAVWALGRALFWNRGLEMILYKVDSALVGELLGGRTLGFYDQARYIAGLPAALVAPVTNLVGLPLISSLYEDAPRRARAFTLLQWGVTRLVFVFALGCVLAPSLAVRVLLGPAWAESAPILRMLALWCVIVPVSTTNQILLTAMQRWRPIRIGFVTAIAVLTATSCALIPHFGPIGAAIGATLAVAAELAIRARATAHEVGLRPRDHVRLGVPLAIAFTVAAAIALAAHLWFEPSWVGEAAVLAVGVAAAALVLLALEGRTARSELRYLRDLIRRRS